MRIRHRVGKVLKDQVYGERIGALPRNPLECGFTFIAYRAVDKYGKTIDFLLTKHRDKAAARRFLNKVIGRNGLPEKITIDGSEANASAVKSYNDDHDTSIELRQIKYLSNIVEQDHRGIKRVTRPMLGFKSFDATQSTRTGIELIRMLRKGQLDDDEMEGLTVAEQFYKLAA